MKLVLASTSPFRKAILEKLGLEFEAASPQTDESPLPNETPQQLVERLAIAKAKSIADVTPGTIIIGSDQVAVIDNEILGKPGSRDRAIEQLKNASGKSVMFYTGLCVMNSDTKSQHSCVEPFEVKFRDLTDDEIESYIDREQPLNCAGSFKSEALGIALFERLAGDDPNTLIGLPLIRTVEFLKREGVSVL